MKVSNVKLTRTDLIYAKTDYSNVIEGLWFARNAIRDALAMIQHDDTLKVECETCLLTLQSMIKDMKIAHNNVNAKFQSLVNRKSI